MADNKFNVYLMQTVFNNFQNFDEKYSIFMHLIDLNPRWKHISKKNPTDIEKVKPSEDRLSLKVY